MKLLSRLHRGPNDKYFLLADTGWRSLSRFAVNVLVAKLAGAETYATLVLLTFWCDDMLKCRADYLTPNLSEPPHRRELKTMRDTCLCSYKMCSQCLGNDIHAKLSRNF